MDQTRALQLGIRHYETIVAIVELGTMTAAARALHSNQPTLSHRLAEAERRLGVKLFDRGRQRRLTPTRAGIATHQAAVRALAILGRNEEILLTAPPEVTAVVRIGVGSYDCFHWYPAFLEHARREHPEIELQLAIVGDTPADALANTEVDLVIAPGTPDGPIELQSAFVDELVLLVAPDHRLADRSSIEPSDLVGETYLTYNSTPMPGFEYDRFVGASDTYPRMVTVVPQTSAIIELVAAGAGVSILSRWALAPAIAAGRVAVLRCGKTGLPLEWQVATRTTEADASPTRRISDLLGQALSG